jgi:alpha-D-xyloside xylohydrolase
MRDPTGNELSAFLTDPLDEGIPIPSGLKVDTVVPYQGSASIRNGNMLVQLQAGALSFFRVESNGTNTLLTSEFTDDKTLPQRYYVHDFRSSSFHAEFSFTAEEEEMVFGVGQQACCKDGSVNKKGAVYDLINFNSQVPIPMWMSDKVCTKLFLFVVWKERPKT